MAATAASSASGLAWRASTSNAWTPSTSSTEDGNTASAAMLALPGKGIADGQRTAEPGQLVPVLKILAPHERAAGGGRGGKNLRIIDGIAGARGQHPRLGLDLGGEGDDDAQRVDDFDDILDLG